MIVGGQILATYDAAAVHFYLADWLGTKRGQASVKISGTTATATSEQTCWSLPFGDDLVCSGSGTDATEHHFTGRQRDTESGLDYMHARYYSSATGLFLSADPSGLTYADPTNPQSLNLYSYALNDPLIIIDPSGLDCIYTDGSGFNLQGALVTDVSDPSTPAIVGQVAVLRGDCASNTDSGHYVDGTVNLTSLTLDSSGGGLGYSFSNLDSGTGGAGVIGLDSGTLPVASDTMTAYGQGVALNIGLQVGPTYTLANQIVGQAAKYAGCAAVATGGAFKSFFGLPANMRVGPPGASTVVRAARSGLASSSEAFALTAARVGGAVASSAAEQMIPYIGQGLLIAQTFIAANVGAKAFGQCSSQIQ